MCFQFLIIYNRKYIICESGVAQWQRGRLITCRSVDRNFPPLLFLKSICWENLCMQIYLLFCWKKYAKLFAKKKERKKESKQARNQERKQARKQERKVFIHKTCVNNSCAMFVVLLFSSFIIIRYWSII